MPTTEDLSAFRCSDAARERHDPLLGTAPPQRRFLLVEQHGGWAYDGFPSAPLPEDLKAEVLRRTEALGARVMLIRRPGRHSFPAPPARAWCVVDTTAAAGQRVAWGTWSTPAGLMGAVERLEQLTRPAAEAGPGPGLDPEGRDEPLILVCTHGKKDVCCAVRGRPVALDLAARWPADTWECSHTGGDRFAANVLLLPDGATYGGLGADTAARVVQDHREGRPDTAYLRGVAGHPRPVQAALVAVHEQLGPLPCGSVVPEGVDRIEVGEGQVAASRVRLRLGDGRSVEVDVQEHLRPAARLTCQAVARKVAQVPVAGAVRVVAAA
ncbi:sucrase ferredoxin [Ornithinimicrobium pekingense]|uniref:Sucrase ferredoxin n=1 Tax=Ornithinimicrobium pekingense TaxID=384677 RepID=A0ABQ2F9U7_9MICO|nr:sucrase ferredoxin [Ornithinimicrobium pekingense]GGK66633.1 hypothetical protein GCM10011509_13730 [Ornithinimicrobium pekingense]